MNKPLDILGKRDAQTFLDEFWQKKPCLIRGAMPAFNDPVTPEELAGLACEEDVQSRLILEKDGKMPWEVRHGTFNENDFTSLPDTHWTLLVQDMNQHVPELAALLDQFNFIPSWRLDDVMVSYAPCFGTVGPHTDQYDVFLLQGMGKRTWQISRNFESKCIDDIELSILENFTAEESWTLESGDMLYLPPGVAHYGVAETDCMTYSIGFRAPLELDLLSAWTDHLVLSDTAQKRYSDPHLKTQTHPGELSHDVMEQLQQLMASLTQRPDEFRIWLAEHFSLPAQDINLSLDAPLSSAAIIDRIKAGETLYRSEFSRFVFITVDTNNIQLFINGKLMLLSDSQAALGRLLCDQRNYIASDIATYLGEKDCCELLTDWINQGHLYFSSDD